MAVLCPGRWTHTSRGASEDNRHFSLLVWLSNSEDPSSATLLQFWPRSEYQILRTQQSSPSKAKSFLSVFSSFPLSRCTRTSCEEYVTIRPTLWSRRISSLDKDTVHPKVQPIVLPRFHRLGYAIDESWKIGLVKWWVCVLGQGIRP